MKCASKQARPKAARAQFYLNLLHTCLICSRMSHLKTLIAAMEQRENRGSGNGNAYP